MLKCFCTLYRKGTIDYPLRDGQGGEKEGRVFGRSTHLTPNTPNNYAQSPTHQGKDLSLPSHKIQRLGHESYRSVPEDQV